MLDLSHLRDADFSLYLHQTFLMDVGAIERVELELVEVTAFGCEGAPPGAVRQPFSLVFRGPKGASYPQRIYRLEHEQMGVMEIFLVPLGPDAEGTRYEAIFN
jgi:hypothetical protein